MAFLTGVARRIQNLRLALALVLAIYGGCGLWNRVQFSICAVFIRRFSLLPLLRAPTGPHVSSAFERILEPYRKARRIDELFLTSSNQSPEAFETLAKLSSEARNPSATLGSNFINLLSPLLTPTQRGHRSRQICRFRDIPWVGAPRVPSLLIVRLSRILHSCPSKIAGLS
jgi:hypothetical protein